MEWNQLKKSIGVGIKMPRKNNKDWTSVAIKKAILKKLDKLKVHQNQSYSEVIENLLKSCSTKREVSELK
jgi:hypothetical protein